MSLSLQLLVYLSVVLIDSSTIPTWKILSGFIGARTKSTRYRLSFSLSLYTSPTHPPSHFLFRCQNPDPKPNLKSDTTCILSHFFVGIGSDPRLVKMKAWLRWFSNILGGEGQGSSWCRRFQAPCWCQQIMRVPPLPSQQGTSSPLMQQEMFVGATESLLLVWKFM